MIAEAFLACLLFLGYTYVGYPALMSALAALRREPMRRRSGELASVSVILVAHNEAKSIPGRLENLLALDYPRDRLEILLASDGSTDGTPERARAYEPAGVTVIAFETRRGKPAVLNDVVPKAKGEIVVLADARQRFETEVVKMLVRSFADPTVGAVSGELMLSENAKGTSVGQGVGFYWRYEKFIRRSEATLDSIPVVTGAIYAIRRHLFETIPEDTLVEDMLIPLRIARRGYRVVFEPRARAWDRGPATAREEFTRKVRTIAGNFQLFWREPWLLNPFQNRLWLQTLSHKGLRLLGPLFLAGALGANLLLLDQPLYRWTLGAQIAFYLAALGGYAARNAKRKVPLLGVPYVFCLLNWATVVAFFRLATGRQNVTWEKAST